MKSDKNEPISILYVMGTGRSGTTILEVMLSNNPGVAGVGELTHIFRDGYLKRKKCACKSPVNPCAFWDAVGKAASIESEKLNRTIRIQRRVESHLYFPLTFLGLIPKKVEREYRWTNKSLLEAVHRISGAQVVVDSSKYAGRAIALSRLIEGRIKIICVTRSPQDLLQAFGKDNKGEQKPKCALSTLLYYIYVLTCCRMVRLRRDMDVLCVNYDDLVNDPQQVMERIEEWSGIDLSVSKRTLQENGTFRVGHMVTGNRLRHISRIKFHPNKCARQVRGFYDRPIVWIMQWAKNILGF